MHARASPMRTSAPKSFSILLWWWERGLTAAVCPGQKKLGANSWGARITLTLTTHITDQLATWLRARTQTVSVAAILATGDALRRWVHPQLWQAAIRGGGGGGGSSGGKLAASHRHGILDRLDAETSPSHARKVGRGRAPTCTSFSVFQNRGHLMRRDRRRTKSKPVTTYVHSEGYRLQLLTS